jgi:DNA modification methylase
MSKKLEQLSKEELIELVRTLKKRKKYGLVWEDKPEQAVENFGSSLPFLSEVPGMALSKLEGSPTNFIIEGDNFHALTVLSYTHSGKIDLIYIDPPYNTGSKDFVYNDTYVDREDTFRHSKWLSFISRRLVLAKDLLTDDGVIFISIGEDEFAQLKVLCDDIFGEENYLTNFIWEKTQHFGRQKVNSYNNADYILAYAKKLKGDKLKELLVEKVKSEFEDAPLFNGGNPLNRITFPKDSVKFNIADGQYSETNDEKYLLEDVVKVVKGRNANAFTLSFRSRWSQKTVDAEVVKGTTFWVKSEKFAIRAIYAGGKTSNESPKQILFSNRNNEFAAVSRFGQKVGVNEEASSELKDIIGEQETFSYPKPKSLLTYLISLYFSPERSSHPNDITVLDFFAGSGTTGHAVLELNAQDNGSRKFILCTNNENGIAENVTYNRIKSAVNGYGKVKGIPANIRYLKTTFVNKQNVDDATRFAVVSSCTEMICVREDAFLKVHTEPAFSIFKGQGKYVAVLQDSYDLQLAIDAINELPGDEPVNIYLFSLSKDNYASDFLELNRTFTVKPIPEGVLEVYRRVAKKTEKSVGA